MPAPSKPRRGRFTPRAARRTGASDDLDWGDDDDFGDLDEMEALLDSLASARKVQRARAVELSRRVGPRGPLARAWLARVELCGVTPLRGQRGADLARAGAVPRVHVQNGRLQAEVHVDRPYRVAVDFLPPPLPLTGAVMNHLADARAAAPSPEHLRHALRDAILAVDPAIFPSPAQMATSCTCGDSKRCEHVVAAVHALADALDDDPDLLLALWGLSEPELRPAAQALVIAPLAPDRHLLDGDLGAIFGIRLEGSEPPSPADPTATAPAPLSAPAPAAARASAPAATPAPAPAPILSVAPAVPSSPPIAPSPAPTRTPPAPRASRRGRAASPPPAPPPPPAPEPAAPAPDLPPSARPELDRAYLKLLGFSKKKIDTWIREGVLRPTDRPDVFERTPEANRRIAELLAR